MSFSRTIRVFLSSTFRDFGEERDLLVKKVFPELRRMCRERQVELVDVDLRWGITEEEALQGKVLPTCLAEIDRARPYFMGFIGDRYGWIPEGSQYPEVVVEREPWLEAHRGGKSVTELEMLHGVLNNPAMAGRAFFYFRDSAYSQAKGGDYAAESTEHAVKLEALRDRLRQSEFPVVEDYPTPEALAERVREDLLKLIDEEYPAEEVPDALTLERMRHEAFGANRRRLFIGKEADIAALDEAMDRDVEGFRPVLITGEAGVGKSALLANWMPVWQERHPDAVFVVHHVDASAEASDPVEMVKRLMHEVCTMTGDAMEAAGEPEEVLEQLPEVLANAARDAQQKGRSWVIILDGLESLSSHKHMRWFPRMAPRGVKLVVCCANGDTAESLSSRMDWARVEVAALRSERCREFITTYLGTFCKKLPEPLLDRILTHPLSGHALWLRTLLEELRLFGKHEEVADRLDTLLSAPPSKSEGEALTIDDLFEHVVSRIELDTGGGHVAASLTALWASYDGLARSELLELTGIPPSKWAEIQIALDESLFESGGQITLNNKFIRKAVADMYLPTAEARQDTHRWLAEWFEAREVTLDVAQERVHNWKQAGDREKLRSTLLEQEVFRVLYAQDEYRLIGHWVALKENVEEAYQEAYKHWPDGEDVDRELAGLLVQAGFYGAFTESLHLRTLAGSERTLGPEHVDTLGNLNSLAQLYISQGRFDEAESRCLRAVKECERTLGPEHPDTLESVNTLAELYNHKGQHDKSEVLYLRALQTRERTLGPEHPDTVSSIHNLGTAQVYQGRFGKAEALFLQALEITERSLGLEHPDTLHCVNSLGIVYKKQRRYKKAEALYIRALESRTSTLGSAHPSTLTSMQSLAALYRVLGRKDEAEALSLRVLKERERTLGEAHPSTLRSVNGLGISYMSQGRYNEAEPLYLRALKARGRTLGEAHPSTLVSVANLAGCYYAQRQYLRAEPLYLRALKGMECTFGPEASKTLNIVNTLAALYEAQRCYSEAESFYLRALAARERTLGEEHPSTLNSINNLAWLRLESALPNPRTLFIRLTADWSDPTRWKHHWARLGLVLCDVMEGADVSVAEAVIDDLIAILGEDHDRVAKGREKIAKVVARLK